MTTRRPRKPYPDEVARNDIAELIRRLKEERTANGLSARALGHMTGLATNAAIYLERRGEEGSAGSTQAVTLWLYARAIGYDLRMVKGTKADRERWLP